MDACQQRSVKSKQLLNITRIGLGESLQLFDCPAKIDDLRSFAPPIRFDACIAGLQNRDCFAQVAGIPLNSVAGVNSLAEDIPLDLLDDIWTYGPNVIDFVSHFAEIFKQRLSRCIGSDFVDIGHLHGDSPHKQKMFRKRRTNDWWNISPLLSQRKC